jgi:tetratricopeptide (TPR) repeat protein
LQDYLYPTDDENIKNTQDEENDDEGDYNMLENLQSAYMDLEYWEEALQIEMHKCQMYLSEGTDEYADSIHAQGKLYLRQEDFSNSKQLYEEALAYFERTENLVQQGHVLISLAGWYFFRNQLDDALESLQRSETMLDSNPALLYKCLDNQGLIYRLWGEFHVALDKYQQALQVVVVDDQETRAALQMHIADMYLALEEPKEALKVYQDLLMDLASTSTADSEKHQLGMRGVLLHNIATIYVDQGEHELALEQFLEALEAKKSAGGEHNPEVAKTLNSLGALHAGSFGEKEVALEYFQQALLIARIHAEDRDNPHDDPDVMNALQNISIIEQGLAGER